MGAVLWSGQYRSFAPSLLSCERVELFFLRILISAHPSPGVGGEISLICTLHFSVAGDFNPFPKTLLVKYSVWNRIGKL